MAQKAFERMIRHVRTTGKKIERLKCESASAMYAFDAYSLGDDLFLFQQEVKSAEPDGDSGRRLMAVMRRKDLHSGRRGYLFIAGTGRFGMMLTPLLSGAFGPAYAHVPRTRRSELLRSHVALGRLTDAGAELLQRDTDFTLLKEVDCWLQSHGFALNEVLFCERTPEALAYTERLGQVWRVRPRVFTVAEMRDLVAQSWQRMESEAQYYVSVRGVHWLTCGEFNRLAEFARSNPAAVTGCLREWVALVPGERLVAMRRPKARGNHAIEFFGISRADAEQILIPSLERLLEGMTLGRMTADDMADVLLGLGHLFVRLLERPIYADLQADETIEALYDLIVDCHETDEEEEQGTIDFDARRIALPGVTFTNGQPTEHPGVDRQSLAVVKHLMRSLSLNEHVEYINIYDVRSAKDLTSGSGKSREIVLKTDRIPVPVSYVQKRLGSVRAGYANYMLTRANVFRALGADYPAFQLLTVVSHGQMHEETPYFLRTRCPGDPLSAIPSSLFRAEPENAESTELPDVVLALAELYGSAAAQNLVVKKYISDPQPTNRFGIGKEIFEFEYDPFRHRPMPANVQICSIRGTMGWPDLRQNSTNLRDLHRFYLKSYALVVGEYWRNHAEACTLNECASAFFDGFERKIEAMHWTYHRNRKDFDTFDPGLRPIYRFREKLDFALWALNRSAADLSALREYFMDYVRDAFIKV